MRQGRIEHGWTSAEFAARLGVSVPTLVKIEKGSPSVAIGTVFNAAELVGVDLFAPTSEEVARLRHERRQVLALLPRRVRVASEDDPDVDF